MSLDVKHELAQNFIDYAQAVNSDRAIPDSTSGLKPVARRILYGCLINGRTSNKPFVKNARIVGDIMGALHPHGDSSIYGAEVRLSQPWVLRYPLIDWHGNQGNVSGDGPAAMRYTEGRLTKLAEQGMLAGLKKRNVEFMPTYDDSEEEPVTLPSIFPNLLCNPNSGIGVAMASGWACHNLGEVQEAILAYMRGEEPMLPGPDFPGGGIIINGKDIPMIMKTGHGSVKIRSRYEVKGDEIIVTEIPYGTFVENLVKQIGEYADAEENKDCGIVSVGDESGLNGARISIGITKNVNPEVLMNRLFAKTALQDTFSYNQIALVNKVPTDLNLKDCCKIYVEHNISCIIKEAEFDLAKAKDRLHIVDGLLKALEDIDNIIALIKKSSNRAAAKDALIEKYGFSEVQAKAILDMRLSSLANLEKVEIQNEKAELENSIKELGLLISDRGAQETELKSRLKEIVDKFGDTRRTEITNIEIVKEKKEKEIAEIVPEDVVVVMTQSGLIKRIPIASFKTQKRGGKGIKTQDDAVLDAIKTNTVDNIMLFSSKGKMYRISADKIPVGTNTTKGEHISSFVKMEPGETIKAVTSLHRKSIPKFVIFVTKDGMVKKTLLEEYFKTNRNSGIQALKLREGDEVVDVIFQDEENIILLTKAGMGIQFATKDMSAVGRLTLGIKGIKLAEGDCVVAALPVHKTTDEVAIFTSNGLGKKFKLNELSTQGRNGKGVIIQKLEGNASVIGAAMVSDEDNLLLCGSRSSICISAQDIPSMGRTAMGNIMIKSGKVVSVTKL